jgi:microcystin-dependent protein
MSDPFLGEISMFGFPFAPAYWSFCQGQRMSISQYSALYALLGIQFGGDGSSYFNLPNLQGRAPVCAGTGPVGVPLQVGNAGGTTGNPVTAPIGFMISQANLPSHNHGVSGVTATTTLTASSTTTSGQSPTPAAGSTFTNSGGGPGAGNVYLPSGTGPNGPVNLGGIGTTLSGATDNAGTGTPVNTSTNFTVPATMPPFLALNFCIALSGIFPSRN